MPYVTAEEPTVWAATILAACGVIAIAVYVLTRWRRRVERARRKEAERVAELARQRALEESAVTFSAKAWVPYGAPDEPEEAPLALAVHGGAVWIHEVRLSFGSSDRGPRSAVADMRCTPWRSARMPVQLHPQNGELQLDWPVPRMVEPEPISWVLDVVWSVERGGPTTLAVVPGGDTNWRHA